jgi:NADH-quinone oxidoreductase subunit M
VFGAFFLIVTLASLGLPGLSGFVGEFLVLVGAFRVNPAYAVIAAFGVVLAAVYMLWLFQRTMQGPLENPENSKLPDLSVREIVVLLPVVMLIFVVGIFPRQALLGKMDASVENTIRIVRQGAQGVPSSGGSGLRELTGWKTHRLYSGYRSRTTGYVSRGIHRGGVQ